MLLASVSLALPVSASDDPILVCTKTANGTDGTYNFPADCDGTVTTLLPTGYDSLYINVRARCKDNFLIACRLWLNLNGDYNSNDYSYDTRYSLPSGAVFAPGVSPGLDMGVVPGTYVSSPSEANSGFEIIIPFAKSTVFHKQVIVHSSVSQYTITAGDLVQADVETGGVWLRPSIGAVTVVDLAVDTGATFEDGSTFEIYAK